MKSTTTATLRNLGVCVSLDGMAPVLTLVTSTRAIKMFITSRGKF